MTKHIDIVFGDPPSEPGGPRFVEVEDDTQASISLGQWIERDDGYWVIRFTPIDLLELAT